MLSLIFQQASWGLSKGYRVLKGTGEVQEVWGGAKLGEPKVSHKDSTEGKGKSLFLHGGNCEVTSQKLWTQGGKEFEPLLHSTYHSQTSVHNYSHSSYKVHYTPPETLTSQLLSNHGIILQV